jgi:hypothetical protein
MAEGVQLGARLPRDLYERLKRSAKANNRSIGAEIAVALEGYFDEQDEVLTAEMERAIEEKVRQYLDRLSAGR